MAYTTVPKVIVGDAYDEDDFNAYYKDNFAASAPDIFTAKGDLAVGTAADTMQPLAAGSNGQILVADSSETTGLKWASGKAPLGIIVIWSGSVGSIPDGWQLCDGTNGTPNLQDRFVVGAGSAYSVDDTGGNSTLNLAHAHDIDGTTTDSGGAHTHTPSVYYESGNGAYNGSHEHTLTSPSDTGATSDTDQNSGGTAGAAAASHTHTIETLTETTRWANNADDRHTHSDPAATTSDGAHTHTYGNTKTSLSSSQSILPPYYALAYIQRVS
jgi:hypothetical protein